MRKNYDDFRAPDGKVWVCLSCGKMSRDAYGHEAISEGWDTSCSLNSGLFQRSKLVIEKGLVVEVKDVKEIQKTKVQE